MVNQDKDQSAQQILKNKSQHKVVPKLRIIRSGLPIRLSELDPKAKDCNRALGEDLKAKKDRMFYKTL